MIVHPRARWVARAVLSVGLLAVGLLAAPGPVPSASAEVGTAQTRFHHRTAAARAALHRDLTALRRAFSRERQQISSGCRRGRSVCAGNRRDLVRSYRQDRAALLARADRRRTAIARAYRRALTGARARKRLDYTAAWLQQQRAQDAADATRSDALLTAAVAESDCLDHAATAPDPDAATTTCHVAALRARAAADQAYTQELRIADLQRARALRSADARYVRVAGTNHPLRLRSHVA